VNRSFLRIAKGPEAGAYYHQFFLRDRPQLAAQMYCKNARTMLAMASTDTKPNDEEAVASVPESHGFYPSMRSEVYGYAATNLPAAAATMNHDFNKRSISSPQINAGNQRLSLNMLQLLDSPPVMSRYQQERQVPTSITGNLVEDMMIRHENERQTLDRSMQAAAAETEYLRQLHMHRMVEISLQEFQKQDQALFDAARTSAQPSSSTPSPPQPSSNTNRTSPPSGNKRASAA
jgi:hypothetical protein